MCKCTHTPSFIRIHIQARTHTVARTHARIHIIYSLIHLLTHSPILSHTCGHTGKHAPESNGCGQEALLQCESAMGIAWPSAEEAQWPGLAVAIARGQAAPCPSAAPAASPTAWVPDGDAGPEAGHRAQRLAGALARHLGAGLGGAPDLAV